MNPLVNQIGQSSSLSSPTAILKALKTNNADDIARVLCNVNPKFRQFYSANRGKTVQQICSENGIDPNALQQFLR